AVIFLQTLLSFASTLFLVYSVFRFRRPLALPAALAMCGFLGSAQVLFYDISLLSDSLYTSGVVLSIAMLILAFGGARPLHFALASTAMALAILVRPAGLYLVVIYLLVLGYMTWNRYRGRAALSFAVPFPAILLAFCAYNYATLGLFVISPFGEANYAGATVLFWERDPRLPDSVNNVLKDLQDSYRSQGITREDLEAVRTSWDCDLLFDIYTKAYNRMIWSAGWGSGTRFGAGDYLHNRKYIKEVSMIAIRRHPDLYAKLVGVNMVMFFRGVGYKFDIYSSLMYRTRGHVPSAAEAYYSGAAKQGPSGSAPAPVRKEDGADLSPVAHLLLRLQVAWQSLHGMIFQRVFWSFAYFAMLAASAMRLARSRGRHLGAFILFVIALVPLGASLVVCLVEEATDRYSYPTQFAYYLLVALAPLLWGPPTGTVSLPRPQDDSHPPGSR
ncbi:MAG TPA: hypothetical protein VKG78_07660, partial [Opitutaceae bacterium]|nr:hypothetical protein [Opitutaceae bacterium]